MRKKARYLSITPSETVNSSVVTDVDDAFVVADEQVAEDAGFIEVAQADHVLHPVDGGRVHGFDVGGVLRGNPVFLCEKSQRGFSLSRPELHFCFSTSELPVVVLLTHRAFIIHNLNLSRVAQFDHSSHGDVKLPARFKVQPHIVPLRDTAGKYGSIYQELFETQFISFIPL